jgi:uncharacterized protein (DUF2062 family)
MKWDFNVKRWAREHSVRLLAIRDTPESIARGVAIGLFLGFTPLIGLRMLLSVACAWVTRSNILAAVLATTLHDVILPFMPAIYLWEYEFGFWLLEHHWPHLRKGPPITWEQWRHWTTFLTVGKPMLIGSLVSGLPIALFGYLVTQRIVSRHQRKRAAENMSISLEES